MLALLSDCSNISRGIHQSWADGDLPWSFYQQKAIQTAMPPAMETFLIPAPHKAPYQQQPQPENDAQQLHPGRKLVVTDFEHEFGTMTARSRPEGNNAMNDTTQTSFRRPSTSGESPHFLKCWVTKWGRLMEPGVSTDTAVAHSIEAPEGSSIVSRLRMASLHATNALGSDVEGPRAVDLDDLAQSKEGIAKRIGLYDRTEGGLIIREKWMRKQGEEKSFEQQSQPFWFKPSTASALPHSEDKIRREDVIMLEDWLNDVMARVVTLTTEDRRTNGLNPHIAFSSTVDKESKIVRKGGHPVKTTSTMTSTTTDSEEEAEGCRTENILRGAEMAVHIYLVFFVFGFELVIL